MKLTVIERLASAPLLPETGSFLNLKLVREAKEALSFTEEEHKTYKFNARPDGSVTWEIPKDADPKGVEIELSDVAIDMIKKALVKLNDDEKMEERHVSLFEKFVL